MLACHLVAVLVLVLVLAGVPATAAAQASSPASGNAGATPAPGQTAHPATPVHSLDEIVISAQAISAPQAAPSTGSLEAIEPQSIIGGDYIHATDSPLSNYTDIIKFTPSVWTVDPNGPGMAETLDTAIRGFQDGYFNVTFDGIPWGDSNDFTHHSTSYFMPQNIGSVVVDRGPGTAATLGDATFGGTVAVVSAAPSKQRSLAINLADGSFNTRGAGVRFDTGQIQNWGGVSAFLDVQSFATNGYLSYAGLKRSNAFLKVVQPLGNAATLTFATNLNKLEQHPPIGETLADIAEFGPRYTLNNDPASQAYTGYNLDRINTDYEYLGIDAAHYAWTLNNTLYTYAYLHDGWNGEDVNGQLPNGTLPPGEIPNGTLYSPTDVPGQRLYNNYRSIGDILRLERPLGPGVLQLGGWYDHQTNYNALFEQDFTDNYAYNPAALGHSLPTPLQSADRLMHDQLFSRQVYLQYVWQPRPPLKITAGDRLVNFERQLTAQVTQGTGQPAYYDESWTRNLPSVDVHYAVSRAWSAYAQWAQGFLAPNLNVLYTTDPRFSNVRPQATTNWQAGSSWTNRRLSAAADVYYINFSNEIASVTRNGIKEFYNLGGTLYRGVEIESTLELAAGFSVYAAGSVNSAHDKAAGMWVPDTPMRTAAIGLQFRRGPLSGSLMDHYIGKRYGNSGNTVPLGGYATTDAAVNWTLGRTWHLLQGAGVSVSLSNLFNNQSIYYWNGQTAGGQDLYFTVPGRSVIVSLSAHL